MEDIQKTKKFESALYGVCENIRGVLLRLPDIVKQNAEEIRLRCPWRLPLRAKRFLF